MRQHDIFQNANETAGDNLATHKELVVTALCLLEQLDLASRRISSSVELGVLGLASSSVQLVLTALGADVGVGGSLAIRIVNFSDLFQIHNNRGLAGILQNQLGVSGSSANILFVSKLVRQSSYIAIFALCTNSRNSIVQGVIRDSLVGLVRGHIGQSSIGLRTYFCTGLSIIDLIGFLRRERGGAQCQSHDHGQHSCNDLLHVCFLHKNLFVSDLTSPLSPAVYNVNIIML